MRILLGNERETYAFSNTAYTTNKNSQFNNDQSSYTRRTMDSSEMRMKALALNYNIMRIANTANFVCNYPHHVHESTCDVCGLPSCAPYMVWYYRCIEDKECKRRLCHHCWDKSKFPKDGWYCNCHTTLRHLSLRFLK